MTNATAYSVALRAINLIDTAMLVVSRNGELLFSNGAAYRLLGGALPEPLREAIADFIDTRDSDEDRPVSTYVEHESSTISFTVRSDGELPAIHVVLLQRESTKPSGEFRFLNERYRITRRQYQILCAIRDGKTNREIGLEFDLAYGTVAGHVARLFERFGVTNRTLLVTRVEQELRRR